MAFKAVKISSKALERLTEIYDASPNAKEQIAQALNTAINDLWIKTCRGEVKLLLTDTQEFEVTARSEFSQEVNQLLGGTGPFVVTKTCKSWVGLSDGLYRFKDTEYFVPAAWFTKVKPKLVTRSTILTAFLALSSLLQSGILLLMLL